MRHLINIPFTGLGLNNGFRGNTWLKNRIEVFKKFVIPSLIHQSNRKYLLWISWRPEEEGNPHVTSLKSTIEQLRNIEFVFTYGGLCFEDDKYDRPESTNRLVNNLSITLPQLYDYLGDHDEILMTINPSDDMYLSHVFQELQEEANDLSIDKPHSIGYKKGFILNMNTLELAEYARHNWKKDPVSTYRTNTTPPFFSILFPRAVFLDPEAHMKWIGPYRSHEYIGDHTEYHELKTPSFIVGTHGENISTTWHHRYRGKILEGKEKEKVFLEAGIYGIDPISLNKDKKRKVEQKFIDLLPKYLRRKWIKSKSPELGSAINNYNYFKL